MALADGWRMTGGDEVQVPGFPVPWFLLREASGVHRPDFLSEEEKQC